MPQAPSIRLPGKRSSALGEYYYVTHGCRAKVSRATLFNFTRTTYPEPFYLMPLPFDFTALTKDDLHGVGLGLTSEVVRIADTNIVAKIPTPSAILGLEVHEIEKKVYERVQDHPNILRYLGQSPPECTLLRGALLFEYHSRGSLIDCLDQLKNFTRSRFVS